MLGHRTMAKPAQLGEDKPHPVRALVTGADFGQRSIEDAGLRIDEAIEIMRAHRTSVPCAGGVP